MFNCSFENLIWLESPSYSSWLSLFTPFNLNWRISRNMSSLLPPTISIVHVNLLLFKFIQFCVGIHVFSFQIFVNFAISLIIYVYTSLSQSVWVNSIQLVLVCMYVNLNQKQQNPLSKHVSWASTLFSKKKINKLLVLLHISFAPLNSFSLSRLVVSCSNIFLIRVMRKL